MFCCFFDITEVGGYAGDTQYAGFLVQDIIHFVYGQVFLLHDIGYSCNVNVTRSCTHYQTFQRCEAHGSINGFTVSYRTNGTAVAQMASDCLCLVIGSVHHFCSFFGYESMGCTVEAISSYFIFFIVFVRQSVHISSFGHCLMESCIEYCYLRYAGHNFFASMDTDQVCGVVQRCQIAAFFDCFDNFGCNDYGVCEIFTAVYYTMANCVDFLHGFHNTVFGVCQCIQNHFNGYAVVFLIIIEDNGFFAGRLMFQSGAFDTDSFTQAFCQYVFCFHVDQLILQGRAAAVQYKNFHFFLSFDLYLYS